MAERRKNVSTRPLGVVQHFYCPVETKLLPRCKNSARLRGEPQSEQGVTRIGRIRLHIYLKSQDAWTLLDHKAARAGCALVSAYSVQQPFQGFFYSEANLDLT